MYKNYERYQKLGTRIGSRFRIFGEERSCLSLAFGTLDYRGLAVCKIDSWMEPRTDNEASHMSNLWINRDAHQEFP